ncbi:MAG: Clp protease N-terminal domain-containing protein [Rothia sp. (in: high G+C Gram-positive bacteria)]|nr:Clp protease N-terminal domain-containing protein [Rothia sp. (in: high G+C Gram-positive bacteria)]
MSSLSAGAAAYRLSATAMEEASRLGQRIADIDHLFLALTLDEQVTGQILRKSGITIEKARAAVAAQHKVQLASLGIDFDMPTIQKISFGETAGYEWSPRALNLLTEAQKKGGGSATILQELVQEPSGFMAEILGRLGTSAQQILDDLAQAQLSQEPSYSPASFSYNHRAISAKSSFFIPADPQPIWDLLSDPERLPVWNPVWESVTAEPGRPLSEPGWLLTATPPTRRNGKPFGKSRRGYHYRSQLSVEQVSQQLSWIFTPLNKRANRRELTFTLRPVSEGSQLDIQVSWVKSQQRRPLSFLHPVLRPVYRFLLPLQLAQVANSISRIFR